MTRDPPTVYDALAPEYAEANPGVTPGPERSDLPSSRSCHPLPTGGSSIWPVGRTSSRPITGLEDAQVTEKGTPTYFGERTPRFIGVRAGLEES